MSMQEQIVRYSANPSVSTTENPNSFHANKKATLVLRLEQELTQAQICVWRRSLDVYVLPHASFQNHRLNQQLKMLANNNDKAIKLELANTKVTSSVPEF